jgi:hypothetical protein
MSGSFMLKLKFTALLVLGAILSISTGCNTQPTHPNQINTFDGASYDSLTLAHAALSSLREKVSTTEQKYTADFNQAATAYAAAYSAYALYRTSPANQTSAALAISNLTLSVVWLENAFRTDMHASPKAIKAVRTKAARFRSAAGPSVVISDILSELEIAAAVAATVPGTQPYSTLAAIVIKATQQALAAANAASAQPIDLSTIQPIAPIQ